MHTRDGFLADQLGPIYVAYNMSFPLALPPPPFCLAAVEIQISLFVNRLYKSSYREHTPDIRVNYKSNKLNIFIFIFFRF